MHMLVHTNIKNIICETCGKAFQNKSHLKKHKLTHLEHKPYICEICQKSFAESSRLVSHMAVHSGIRPFSCETCGRKYIHKCKCFLLKKITHFLTLCTLYAGNT